MDPKQETHQGKKNHRSVLVKVCLPDRNPVEHVEVAVYERPLDCVAILILYHDVSAAHLEALTDAVCGYDQRAHRKGCTWRRRICRRGVGVAVIRRSCSVHRADPIVVRRIG